MKYTKPSHKAQIKKEFLMLLMQHDTNLHKFCGKFKYNYSIVWASFARNSITHDFVNEMIHKLDKKKSLQFINGELLIR